MNRRPLVIGAATALAAAVLVLSLLAGRAHDRKAPAERDPRADRPAGPADVAPGFDPDKAIGDDFTRQRPFETVHRGGYTVVEGDRKTVMTWDRLTPRPQGVSDVTKPLARVYFEPGRVLEIRADEGTLIAPENQPREGDLRGNVVLTLFETEDGSAVDFESGQDIELQTFLDKATFDLEFGHVESAGDVHLTGPRVEFRGRGLSLTYNELRRRIERLEITQGQSLTFKAEPRSERAQADATPVATSAATTQPAQPSEVVDASTAAQAAKQARARQFYRARFDRNVHVDVEAGEMVMDADALVAIFSMDSSDDEEENAAAKPTRPRSANASQSRNPNPQSPTPNPEPAVTITWTGSLLVVPEPEMPRDFASEDDALLRLVGSPAVVRTARQETVVASEIDYLTMSGRIRAVGNIQQPMRIESDRLGVLTGTRLSIDQAAGTGFVVGPGTLAAVSDRPSEAATQPVARDLNVAWRDRLDLAFYMDGEAEQRQADPHDIRKARKTRAIKSAMFHGNVVVEHPQFDMTGQTLALHLAEPDSGEGDIQAIDASGDVTVAARGETAEETFDIACDELTLAMAVDAQGKSQPQRLIARRQVKAAQPGMVLRAQSLDVAMQPRVMLAAATTQPTATQPSTQPATQPAFVSTTTTQGRLGRIAIQRMIAEDEVSVTLEQQEVQLAGSRLHIDPEADQLELFGSAGSPAKVVRPDATLAGQHIVMHQTSRQLHVNGSGAFDVQMDQADPTARLRTTWAKALHYDDAAGQAHFVGSVVATTSTQQNRTRLICDDLQLNLEEVQPASTATTQPADVKTQRRIRLATARDNVVFTAADLSDGVDAAGKPLTQVHLQGPLMTFDGQTEQVQVVGQGRLLIQDHRPLAGDAKPESADGVNFTGRGDTLFLWQRQLTLDAKRNDMAMHQTVQMIHRPAAGGDVVQLDAQHLLADLKDTGGLGMWRSSDGPRPTVDTIEANDNVRIIQGSKTVTADHLKYAAAEQAAWLWADNGGMVQVSDDTQPAGLSAGQVKWDLLKDRLEAMKLGPGVVPIR